jgi:hypothetical protein
VPIVAATPVEPAGFADDDAVTFPAPVPLDPAPTP